MRQAEQDGEHIWLRQSVTFTANGQTRTVEMAIPLRPGAPDEEIEHLLSEAEAGMRRISARLDSHVAELLNGGGAPAAASHVAPAPTAAGRGLPAEPPPEPPRPLAPTPAPTPEPAAAPTPAARPERAERPAPAAAPAHVGTPTPTPANPPSRPAPAPRTEPAAASERARPSGPLPTPAPVPAGAELTRKDFIAAATEMGLNVKQVMERLHVRTLEGLDLREALEALRRQMLRDGETPSAPAATAAPTAPASANPRGATPAAPAASAPAATPRYFEEEDDDDVTFTMDGEDALVEEFGPYDAPGAPSSPSVSAPDDLEDLDALDDFELDDVPDFGPPPSATHTTRPAPARRAAGAPAKATPTTPPASATPPAGEQAAEPAISPEMQRITQLRAIRGGGTPSTYQRSAYRNVVVNELGDEAAALVRGLWRVAPERLGPEQLDALISWGKQDTFAEEAIAALATLRAERQQAAAAAGGAAAPEGAPAAGPRPATRQRAASPPQASSGGR